MNDLARDEYIQNTPFGAPAWMIQLIDIVSKRLSLSRSAWIRQAVIEKLERDGYLDRDGRRIR
jgi:hypothetical protein